LEANLDQLFEHAQLALDTHGLDQRLVAVTKIGTHPDGRMGDALAWPGSFGKIAVECHEGAVFFSWIRDHDAPDLSLGYDAVAVTGRLHGRTKTRGGRKGAAELPRALGSATDR